MRVRLAGVGLVVVMATLAVSASPADERMNPLIRLLEQGKPAIGVWTAAMAAPRIAKVLAQSDADYIVADVEHDLYDFRTLQQFLLEIQDYQRFRSQPRSALPAVLVKIGHRAGWDPRYEIAESLKAGPAAGVWIPFVESGADLAKAISAVRGAETSAMGGMNLPRDRRDVWPLNPKGELVVVAMIESDEGVRHAAEIVSTPGVTAIEPVHLSDADTAMIVRLCKEKNVILAADATPETINARIAEGYRLLSVGWDYALLNNALGGAVKGLRGAIK